MAQSSSPKNFEMPTPQQVLALDDGKPQQAWWRFWFNLYTLVAADVPYTAETALTATGTTQGTALALESEWSEITTTAANSGVRLFSFGIGLTGTVFNAGANALKVYPPIGGSIDALGVNAPYVLAAGKSQVFYQLTDTAFRSQQLG